MQIIRLNSSYIRVHHKSNMEGRISTEFINYHTETDDLEKVNGPFSVR